MPIAPGSFTQLPPNSTGPKLATGPTYTENANVVQDEKVVLSNQYLASFRVRTASVSLATADAHVLQIMAPATNNVWVRHIWVYQNALATTAIINQFDLLRLTTAGTGGTVITPSPLDESDTATFTAMVLPTVKGTEGALIDYSSAVMIQTVTASLYPAKLLVAEFIFDSPMTKGLRIGAGITKGIAVKPRIAVAAATCIVVAEVVEQAWA